LKWEYEIEMQKLRDVKRKYKIGRPGCASREKRHPGSMPPTFDLDVHGAVGGVCLLHANKGFNRMCRVGPRQNGKEIAHSRSGARSSWRSSHTSRNSSAWKRRDARRGISRREGNRSSSTKNRADWSRHASKMAWKLLSNKSGSERSKSVSTKNRTDRRK